MAIYVYNTATGVLVSYCPNDTDPVASAQVLTTNGLTALTGQPALDSTHQWQASPPSVVVVAAPEVPNWLPAYDFALAFTPTEFAAIKASTDATVQHFMFALGLAQQVDMNSQTIQQGVAYLVSVNLLTQDRATAILATVAS